MRLRLGDCSWHRCRWFQRPPPPLAHTQQASDPSISLPTICPCPPQMFDAIAQNLKITAFTLIGQRKSLFSRFTGRCFLPLSAPIQTRILRYIVPCLQTQCAYAADQRIRTTGKGASSAPCLDNDCATGSKPCFW